MNAVEIERAISELASLDGEGMDFVKELLGMRYTVLALVAIDFL